MELFNKQFPKITFTTAYKTDLGLTFQDVRILWSINPTLAATWYGKNGALGRYTAFCLPQHIPMTAQKGCLWGGLLLRAPRRWFKRWKTIYTTHLKRAEQMLLSTCPPCLSLTTTFYANCHNKRHEHRWALLSMHFFPINVAKTKKMALGFDYVNCPDRQKFFFQQNWASQNGYFCPQPKHSRWLAMIPAATRASSELSTCLYLSTDC